MGSKQRLALLAVRKLGFKNAEVFILPYQSDQ